MSGRLAGQSAMVTGAGRGIGRAIAVRLASEGAHVLAADIDEAGADATAAAIRDAGGAAVAWSVDVTDRQSLSRLVKEAVALKGRLDIAVSNAGIMDRMPFLEMTDDFWHKVLGLNLSGAFMCGQEAARQMVAQSGGGGRIVFVASNSGLFGGRGRAAYGASKAGLMNLTQSMPSNWPSMTFGSMRSDRARPKPAPPRAKCRRLVSWPACPWRALASRRKSPLLPPFWRPRKAALLPAIPISPTAVIPWRV